MNCDILRAMVEDFVQFSVIGGTSGVYLLLLKGEVVYAGQSTNVFARISTHWVMLQKHRKGKRPYGTQFQEAEVYLFDEVRMKLCLVQDLDREELALIQRFRPKHNTLLNRPVNPLEGKIKDLPVIQALAKLAAERETKATGNIRRRPVA